MSFKQKLHNLKIWKLALYILSTVLFSFFFVKTPLTFTYKSVSCEQSPLMTVSDNAFSRWLDFWPSSLSDNTLYLEEGEDNYYRYALLPTLDKTVAFGCSEADFSRFVTNQEEADQILDMENILVQQKSEKLDFARTLSSLVIVAPDLLPPPRSSSYQNKNGGSLVIEQAYQDHRNIILIHSTVDPCSGFGSDCAAHGIGNMNNQIIKYRGTYHTNINQVFVTIGATAGTDVSDEQLLTYIKNLQEYSVEDLEKL